MSGNINGQFAGLDKHNYTTMSKQALESERVRSGLRDILLGPAQLYEALRSRADEVAKLAT